AEGFLVFETGAKVNPILPAQVWDEVVEGSAGEEDGDDLERPAGLFLPPENVDQHFGTLQRAEAVRAYEYGAARRASQRLSYLLGHVVAADDIPEPDRDARPPQAVGDELD